MSRQSERTNEVELEMTAFPVKMRKMRTILPAALKGHPSEPCDMRANTTTNKEKRGFEGGSALSGRCEDVGVFKKEKDNENRDEYKSW